MKGFVMTPRLAEVLAGFCDEELMQIQVDALEKIQDFIISCGDSAGAEKALMWLRFIRELKGDLQNLCVALRGGEEGGES